jgi:hypothetical protein
MKKLTRIINEKRVIQFTMLVIFVGVMLLVFQIHQLDKALTQEKYLHQQSIESLSELVEYYSDYSIQLEDTIKDWRVRYDINDPLAEKENTGR